MYNIMCALDIEDNIDGLRYGKVILATDADVDGLHIRNLMITYFFKFFEQLVHDGHVYPKKSIWISHKEAQKAQRD